MRRQRSSEISIIGENAEGKSETISVGQPVALDIGPQVTGGSNLSPDDSPERGLMRCVPKDGIDALTGEARYNPLILHDEKAPFPSAAPRPPVPAKRPQIQAVQLEKKSVPTKSAGAQNGGQHTMRLEAQNGEVTPQKLSTEVRAMIKELFGPPEGSDGDVETIESLFKEEGIERIVDVKLLTREVLSSIPGMKGGWQRRILNHVAELKTRTEPSLADASEMLPKSIQTVRVNTVQPEFRTIARPNHRLNEDLLSHVNGFSKNALRPVEKSERPKGNQPRDVLLQEVKGFTKASLRKVDAVKEPHPSPSNPINDPSGFLGTLLTAMRSRRVLIDDLDFDSQRRGVATSDVDKADVFEAEWT